MNLIHEEKFRLRRQLIANARKASEATDAQLIDWILEDDDMSRAALMYLRSITNLSIETRASRICVRNGHLGKIGACPGSGLKRNSMGFQPFVDGADSCDRMWPSAYHTLTAKCFGLRPLGSDRYLPGVEPDLSSGPPKKHSILTRKIQKDGDLLKFINAKLTFTGTASDCLRQWNTDRGLVQRVDQKEYLTKKKDKTDTPFYLTLIKEWSVSQQSWVGRTLPDLEKSDISVFLKSIYSDACQWGYEDERITASRAKRGYLTETSMSVNWRRWLDQNFNSVPELLAHDNLIKVLELFVRTLQRACSVDGSESPEVEQIRPMYVSMTDAWTKTRHERRFYE